MAKFDFKVQQKVTVWNDVKFSVEANSKEEAIEYIKKHRKFDIDTLACQGCPSMDKEVEIIDIETLFETEELIEPNENGGCATVEYYDDNNLICDNV